MNTEPGSDREIRDFLIDRAQGTLTLADIDAIDRRVRAQPQGRAWLTARGALAAAAGVAAVAAIASLLTGPVTFMGFGASSAPPASQQSPVPTVASVGPSPSSDPTPSNAVASSTVQVGEWQARCIDVADAECIGASERFVNLLAWAGSSVFRQSEGVLSVTPRPTCPAVPATADGSYCWQVTAPGSLKGDGMPWCMVIARRGSDTRYPPFVAVGGDSGAGRFEMPEGWPSCTFEPTDVTPASRSNPTSDALAALTACHIGDLDLVPFDKVTGMGRIERASDLVHYLPLSGLEPQLSESGPVWIVTVDADLPQPGSGETWVDPTCVVTSSGAGWLATGPVRNDATGVVSQPPAPPVIPDRSIPTLAP